MHVALPASACYRVVMFGLLNAGKTWEALVVVGTARFVVQRGANKDQLKDPWEGEGCEVEERCGKAREEHARSREGQRCPVPQRAKNPSTSGVCASNSPSESETVVACACYTPACCKAIAVHTAIDR
jgi:hypothetical protein